MSFYTDFIQFARFLSTFFEAVQIPNVAVNYTLEVHELRQFQWTAHELDSVRGLRNTTPRPCGPSAMTVNSEEAMQIFHRNHHTNITSMYMSILILQWQSHQMFQSSTLMASVWGSDRGVS